MYNKARAKRTAPPPESSLHVPKSAIGTPISPGMIQSHVLRFPDFVQEILLSFRANSAILKFKFNDVGSIDVPRFQTQKFICE